MNQSEISEVEEDELLEVPESSDDQINELEVEEDELLEVPESSDDQINELKFIAEEIRAHPEILSKSQVPSVKKRKDQMLEKLIQKYEAMYGKPIDGPKLLKKINNIKTRLKKKTDKKATGNKPIKLSHWEKVLFDAMEGELNPTVAKIPGAKSCGNPKEKEDEEEISNSAESTRKKTLKNFKMRIESDIETEETKKLSNTELQRLVLLEQLKTTRIQREIYSEKLNALRLHNL